MEEQIKFSTALSEMEQYCLQGNVSSDRYFATGDTDIDIPSTSNAFRDLMIDVVWPESARPGMKISKPQASKVDGAATISENSELLDIPFLQDLSYYGAQKVFLGDEQETEKKSSHKGSDFSFSKRSRVLPDIANCPNDAIEEKQNSDLKIKPLSGMTTSTSGDSPVENADGLRFLIVVCWFLCEYYYVFVLYI